MPDFDIGKATELFFGEPACPTIPSDDAFVEARTALAELHGATWLQSDRPVMEGALFDITGRRVAFPDSRGDGRWWVFFADPSPRAKWGHPAWWVFVPAARWHDPARNVDRTTVVETIMPPHHQGPVTFANAPLAPLMAQGTEPSSTAGAPPPRTPPLTSGVSAASEPESENR